MARTEQPGIAADVARAADRLNGQADAIEQLCETLKGRMERRKARKPWNGPERRRDPN